MKENSFDVKYHCRKHKIQFSLFGLLWNQFSNINVHGQIKIEFHISCEYKVMKKKLKTLSLNEVLFIQFSVHFASPFSTILRPFFNIFFLCLSTPSQFRFVSTAFCYCAGTRPCQLPPCNRTFQGTPPALTAGPCVELMKPQQVHLLRILKSHQLFYCRLSLFYKGL